MGNNVEKKLWEIKHPYYCSTFEDEESAYKSFDNFLKEAADEDLDLNLIFRWDWSEQDEDDENNFNGDIYYRNGQLTLFYVSQRKARFRSCCIDVCRADEDSVKDFLENRWAKIKELWEPFC